MGLAAVSISLPAVNSIGYAAATEGLGDKLKESMGLTLAEQHVYTVVKGAIVGPSSGLNADGTSVVVTVAQSSSSLPWERCNAVAAAWRSSTASNPDDSGPKQSRHKTSTLMADVQSSSAPLESLQGALRDKVSVMTMLNREDIRVDVGLDSLGLDSLVSVELRNWIRREFGTELALAGIMGAGNLKGLSEKIMALMPGKA